MKINNIVGNPPFQDNLKKGKTQHKIWTTFTIKALEEWLADDGNLLWITPLSWGSPNNKVLDLFKKYNLKTLSLDTGKYFPEVGSTFSHYHVIKENKKTPTSIFNNAKNYSLLFDQNIVYVPNDVSDLSLSIHKKVIFDTQTKLNVGYDYTTCHNVIRHAEKLNVKKIEKLKKELSTTLDINKQQKLSKRIEALSGKQINISISEVKTSEHIHKILHTNNKFWYSSKKQDILEKKKVLWSRSGYTKAFYDDGTMGCSDMGYYIIVETEEQGQNLAKFLNSDLMQYIFTTAKWSGFGNERVFCSLPAIDLDIELSNNDYYSLFNITEDEIKYLKTKITKKKNKQKSQTKSKGRVKQFGEVFTPPDLVLELLNLLNVEVMSDPTQTFLDPACGNGNFLVEVTKKRIELGVKPEEVAKTVFGIDIQHDNVSECRDRLLEIYKNCGKYVDMDKINNIINKNIICNNALSCNLDILF